MKKYFVFGETKLSKDENISVKKREQERLKQIDNEIRDRDSSQMNEEDALIHVTGKIIVKIDLDSKDKWAFSDGTVIDYKRRFNNLNLRETNPVNCIVISGEDIPKNTEILVHPNSIHDSNRIFDYKVDNSNIRYYSIPKDMCFAYYDNDWKPLKGFDFALRVFKPYTGVLLGIEPELIERCLYVTTGELEGKVVMTLVACDYEIVFQGKDLREQRLIRFRPFGDPENQREEEAVAILDDFTDKVINGEYYVGLSISDAKQLDITAYAD